MLHLMSNQSAIKPVLSTKELLEFLEIEKKNISTHDLFFVDTSNIQPEDWVEIAKYIDEQLPNYDGFVICHGTDTMAYTASALIFMLKGILVPVVLTGSQHLMIAKK